VKRVAGCPRPGDTEIAMGRTRLILLGVAGAFVALLFFLEARGMDREQHAHSLAGIIDLQRSHERLDRGLALVRADMQRTDQRIEDELRRVQAAAQRVHEEVGNTDSASFDAALQCHDEALARAGEHIEKYEALCAAWRSNLQRLSADLDTIESVRVAGADGRAEVRELLSAVTLFHFAFDERVGERLRAAIESLRRLAPTDEGGTLARLATEASALADTKTRLDGELALIEHEDLGRLAAELLTEHERVFDARLRQSELIRLGLYLLTLALLARLLQSMRELRKRTAELHDANHMLEERVDERTRRLSAANTALQIEIFERSRAETEAVRILKQAEAASRTKSEFLANMSHEIRTPMTSILGFSERLLDESLNDTDKIEAISMIRRNGDYLLQIINDILDISKIEAGKLTIERIPCSPRQIVAEVHSAMDVRASIEGLEFGVEWRGPLPERIVTDPVRLKQVLLNLVGNAIKFTPKGSVRLSVEFVPGELDDLTPPSLRFSVIDTGIGMEPETLERLFRAFSQADSSTTRRFGGTGLGLSISKHLVERLGGSISVESTAGSGSVFTFSIETGDIADVPMIAVQELSFLAEFAGADPRRPLPHMEGARILLAEDGEDNRRLISYILATAHAQVDIARDGREAVQLALAAQQSGDPYHAILMDMQMPVLDGYAATKRLREQGCWSPIIALTAHAMATDRVKCLEAGCDDFCTKPIVRATFLATVAQWVERRLELVAAPPITPAKAAEEAAAQEAELLELVHMFVDDLGADIDEMRSALERGDLDSLAQRAHRLKGAAGSYGFPLLTTYAASLEKRAKGGADRAELERDLETVVALCAAARAETRFPTS
jgi:signal transduction histidine kinase/CheY-like chemotaxis protein/HPt (histidine-containing phosphotransfer) domain-containing protein